MELTANATRVQHLPLLSLCQAAQREQYVLAF